MPSPNDIKKGTIINKGGDLWLIVDFQRVSPGKGGSFVRTKMKNLKTGKVNEENMKASETLTFEDVNYKKMQFLFSDGHLFTFMDNQNYEQVAIGADEIESAIPYLKEGLEVKVAMHNGAAMTIELPQKIQYSVVYTEPAVKGDTASGNVLKDAELDNGLKVRVPSFINQGDEILINTDSGDYTERVSK
ncbi:elongation factor P [Candidatus Uhrbacteria bacterium CG_4_9_14_3_um_filter_50_9]|uniref:Elongation factor P n=1 Tax=Candidatus Uhrbacteria bacterium CG_4_9_14_3_um_filter_50_9 TaxID=1975035 RepID=A0A2M7XCH3_9BACT|nr:MAG: elongation factor P [Candidatus Uhrbacteria bacterium CG_4_9_14_3_um_filter_50_9]